MQDLLQSLGNRVDTQRKKRDERIARHSRAYNCCCGNHVFFSNTLCLACRVAAWAYCPMKAGSPRSIPGPTAGTWRVEGRDEVLKFCANRDSQAACNWMMYAHNPKDVLHCLPAQSHDPGPRRRGQRALLDDDRGRQAPARLAADRPRPARELQEWWKTPSAA